MALSQHFLVNVGNTKHVTGLLDQAEQLDKPYISEQCNMHLLAHNQRQIAELQSSSCPLRQHVGLGRACRREQLSKRRGLAPVRSIAGPSFESIDSDDFLSPVTTLVSVLWFCSCGLFWQRDV